MNLSYWEQKNWFSDLDAVIIGSGIVGLSTALHIKHKHPDAKVVVLEKGILPQGASTKNAGFACFGSISEILSDLSIMEEDDVLSLIEQRKNGLDLLRNTLGDSAIGYEQNGSYELFLPENRSLYQKSLDSISKINDMLKPIFNDAVFHVKNTPFGMKNLLSKSIFSPLEGQLETGQMMLSLLHKVHNCGVLILNSIEVEKVSVDNQSVLINTSEIDIKARQVMVCTNGFSRKLLPDLEVTPARAQVLITEPIPDLNIQGTFHLDEGYYYFRNIDNRILLGGGRNLDIAGETTTDMNTTLLIQERLEALLKETILPDKPHKIDQRWSGIMGVGKEKSPIIKTLSDRIHCGIRLGGMGVALGSNIGAQLAKKYI